MKSTPVAFGCLLAAFVAAGCQNDEFPDSSRAWGKPVVVLASVSEASGSARDLTPAAPYTIPGYPAPLLQAGVEGFVDVRLGILADGSVKDAHVLKSTEKDFEDPVLVAVKTWQFPKLRREKSAADHDVDIVCRIRFSIQQYWYDSVGSAPGGSPDPKGGTMSVPSRSQEIKAR